ncbi:hypothetical protein Tco_1551723, partial [Tanacetum coccineum]
SCKLYTDDPVIQDIINTIEGSPPADVSSVRSMYEHLAKSAPAILDDSLYADSYRCIRDYVIPKPEKELHLELFLDLPFRYESFLDEIV